MTLREAVRDVGRGYGEHDILTFAAAIAFQVLFAIIPLAPFGLGLLGGLGLEDQWTREWARARSSRLVLWLRWPVCLALLFAVIARLVAYAPVERRPLQQVTFGSVVVVSAWVGTTLVLGWYLTAVANYGSVFGALATVVAVLTYLCVASVAVLTGAELDAPVRARVLRSRAASAGSAARRSASQAARG